MAKMLKGTGDFDPPEDEDQPECRTCEGAGVNRCEYCDADTCDACGMTGVLECGDCNGTGYQPEPEYEPGLE